MKTICLVMIVRNESKIIKRCLDRVKDKIDYWVIVDTGSEDNTKEIILETLWNIPGELHQHEWKNFGYNRTESLKLAKNKADYLLLCDADEQIIFSENFNKESLVLEQYLLSYIGNIDYSVPYLIRGDIDWYYVGVTHEYLSTDKHIEREKLSTISILDLHDGGYKQHKYVRDIELLTKGLENEPNNSRYMFYLANSYRDIGDYLNAVKWYRKRIDSGGWIEEVTCSYERLGQCYEALGEKEKALYYWLMGYNYNSKRAECIYRAVRQLRIDGKTKIGYYLVLLARQIQYPKNDTLFINRSVYDYLIEYEYSILCYYADEYISGYNSSKALILNTQVPAMNKKYVIQNLIYYIDGFKQDTVENRGKLIFLLETFKEQYPDVERNTIKVIEQLKNV